MPHVLKRIVPGERARSLLVGHRGREDRLLEEAAEAALGSLERRLRRSEKTAEEEKPGMDVESYRERM